MIALAQSDKKYEVHFQMNSPLENLEIKTFASNCENA